MENRLIAKNICDRCGSETETEVICLGEKILFEKTGCVCNICVPGSLWCRASLLTLQSEEKEC